MSREGPVAETGRRGLEPGSNALLWEGRGGSFSKARVGQYINKAALREGGRTYPLCWTKKKADVTSIEKGDQNPLRRRSGGGKKPHDKYLLIEVPKRT